MLRLVIWDAITPLWGHCNVASYGQDEPFHVCSSSEDADHSAFWQTHDCPNCYKPISHYDDVIMGVMATQITSLTIVYSTVYSGSDQSKHQSSASLAFVWGSHRGPVNSPHKWPVTRKMFPFDDVIMRFLAAGYQSRHPARCLPTELSVCARQCPATCRTWHGDILAMSADMNPTEHVSDKMSIWMRDMDLASSSGEKGVDTDGEDASLCADCSRC